MRYSRQLIAVTLVAASACSNPELRVQKEDYAVIYLDAETVGGESSFSPVATFFRSQPLGIATSTTPEDNCFITSFVDTLTPLDNTTGLDAGATVTVNVSGDSISLTPTAQPSIRTYRVPGAQQLVFTPGDTVRVTIPGAVGGFIASTIAARTADAFTRSALPVPGALESIDLTWTPDTRAGSSMLVSMRYSAAGTGTLDSQVFCSLVDDGAFTIPSDVLAGWRAASVREAVTSRWRTEVKQIGNSFLIASSTYSLRGMTAQP